jgi:hypothetical protein
MVGNYGLDAFGSGQGKLACACEQCTELRFSKKAGNFLTI